MLNKKNVVAGMGEIGSPIFELISKKYPTFGYDIDSKLIKKKKITNIDSMPTSFLHICIPFTKKFTQNVLKLCKKFVPEIIVIHSTISPYTTKNIQKKLKIPVMYSATRGIHSRMLQDLRRYTKFFSVYGNAPKAISASSKFRKLMKDCGVKTKKISTPITLEVAKIVVDTSYYGWLISYSQISNMIAREYDVNYDEMWTFSDEIHKFLGNRPKMFPGFIGGHCVIPNLALIDNVMLNMIDKINKDYAKEINNKINFIR